MGDLDDNYKTGLPNEILYCAYMITYGRNNFSYIQVHIDWLRWLKGYLGCKHFLLVYSILGQINSPNQIIHNVVQCQARNILFLKLDCAEHNSNAISIDVEDLC